MNARAYALARSGAIPVFLTPTRNHLGIIGPIALEEFQTESIQRKIEANPFAREAKNKRPRILSITQSTYDGVLYNVETLKEILSDLGSAGQQRSGPWTRSRGSSPTWPRTASSRASGCGAARAGWPRRPTCSSTAAS